MMKSFRIFFMVQSSWKFIVISNVYNYKYYEAFGGFTIHQVLHKSISCKYQEVLVFPTSLCKLKINQNFIGSSFFEMLYWSINIQCHTLMSHTHTLTFLLPPYSPTPLNRELLYSCWSIGSIFWIFITWTS